MDLQAIPRAEAYMIVDDAAHGLWHLKPHSRDDALF